MLCGLKCERCGNCCSAFPGLSLIREDYKRWQDADRWDIIDIIQSGKTKNENKCIFLRKGIIDDIYYCTIYDLRPKICRNFPETKEKAMRHCDCQGVKNG